ncbi:MAG: TonB-dependent receptor [Verrucomicrobiota bacterium]
MRAYQRRGLEDILRQTAGVTLVQSGQTGAQTSLFIRGQESDHAVVLLNGRRLPPGLAGIYQLEFLDASTLESVQIHRGAVSSIYGSDALAGAIDLRSTDARFVQSNTVSGYAETGSWDTRRAGTRVTVKDGAFTAALDGSWTETENDFEPDTASSAFENGVIRGNFAVELGDGVFFDVLGYLQDGRVDTPGARGGFGFPSAAFNQNRGYLVSPRFSILRDDWDLSVLYSHSGNDLLARDTGGFDNDLFQTGEEFEAVFNVRPSDRLEFTIGSGHYQYEFIRLPTPTAFGSPSGFEYAFTGVFGQASIDLTETTNLLASYRYDEFDAFASRGTYLVSLSQEIEATGTTVFGKIATGYKAPAGQDYAFLDPSVNPAVLRPEENETIEFGLRQELFEEKASFALTYFRSDIDNLIDGNFNFVTNTIFPTLGDAETEGVEIEARITPTENLEIYANYTKLDAFLVQGQSSFASVQPGDRLPRRPEHSINGGFLARGDAWTFGGEFSSAYQRFDVGNVALEDFTVARFFGSYELNEFIEIYGRVENVFDERYDPVPGFPAARTAVFGGVRIALGQ